MSDIDPNDPDNLYNGGNAPDTEDYNNYNVLNANVSKRNSYNPSENMQQHIHNTLQPIDAQIIK